MSFASTLVDTLNSLYVIPISEDMGLTRSQYMMTSTITAISCIIATPLIGKFMTQKNLRKVQLTATLTMAIAYASFALATSAWHLYLASVFIGFTFMAAGMIPASVMITNWFHHKQGLAMSIVFAGINVGGMVLSPVITNLIIHLGWRSTRLIIALIFIAAALPTILFVLKATPEEMGLKPYTQKIKGNTNTRQSAKQNLTAGIRIPLASAQKKGFYYLFMLGMVVSGFACAGGMQHIGPFATDLHDPIFASLMISIYSFSAIVGKLALGWLYDKYGHNQSLLFGGVLFLGAFGLMAFFGTNQVLMGVAAAMFGIGNSTGSINANFIAYSIFGKSNYSYVLALSKSTQEIGKAIGPLTLALMYDYIGDYKIPWILSFIFVAIYLFSWVKSYNHSRHYV
jgi:MFS family permease